MSFFTDIFRNSNTRSLADYPCGSPENIEYQAWQLGEAMRGMGLPREVEAPLRDKLREAVHLRATLSPAQVLLNEVSAAIEGAKHGTA